MYVCMYVCVCTYIHQILITCMCCFQPDYIPLPSLYSCRASSNFILLLHHLAILCTNLMYRTVIYVTVPSVTSYHLISSYLITTYLVSHNLKL